MKDPDLLPTSNPATNPHSGKRRYKLYALFAILLLSFWSLFTGTVTVAVKSLTGTDTSATVHRDLDILEVEERERVVRKMWDVYSHNHWIQLPRFWREAFEAAYEELTGDEPQIRDYAISEIARMSMQKVLDPESFPRRSKNTADKRSHLVGGKGQR